MPGQAYDPAAEEERWQRRWEEAALFEARGDEDRPAYFVNVPYPYMNSFLHLGFGYTFLHADIAARYQRMRGFNVLFPQAFHCTGLPILGAAKRVAEGEEGQIALLRNMGIPASEVEKFADPDHWIRVFPREARRDLAAFGASVDWSRSFITTDRNPAYDAFVQWQFQRLRDEGYLRLGKHPVVWCPRDEIPIGDHDRYEGEGEVPTEFTLLKFRLMQRYVVTATLRPETVFGTTNVWVDPEVEYVDAQVGDERWIVNEGAVEKLRAQGREVIVRGRVKGQDLVGQSCVVPLVGEPVPILPSAFIDQSIGTGVVSSVPASAPDDLVALRELQGDEETVRAYDLDVPFVQSLEPIPIIELEGYGPMAAQTVVERMGIRSQKDREKLQAAKEEVYREEYYRGVMNDRCGEVAGRPVEEAKEVVRTRMREAGQADVLYEPSGRVVCRCLTEAIVKVVEDQWFLAYGDEEWKTRVHEAVDEMDLYPDALRDQFHHLVDWLRDWAATHHQGLGTRLPWDENWVIESLSDSTIYMAYYAVAHILQGGGADPDRLEDALFDFVFLGRGSADKAAAGSGLETDQAQAMRREFEYWYPFDLRHTGKDLVPNHMTFCLFNHVALFPRDQWPRAFGVNGFLSLKGGEKMSKSRGGAVYLRNALGQYGADVTRLTLAQGGEGLDDPTFDADFAESAGGQLASLYEDACRAWETSDEASPADAWFRSVLHRAVQEATEAMEALRHRTALKLGYFDLQRRWKWYLRRRAGVPHPAVLREYLTAQTKLLAPYVPHVAEAMWEALGGDGFVAVARWPEGSGDVIDPTAERREEYLRTVLDDVRQILKATGLSPKRVVFYVAAPWKRAVVERAAALHRQGGLEVGSLVKAARRDAGEEAPDRALAAFAKELVSDVERRGPLELERFDPKLDEAASLRESTDFLERELGATVAVHDEEEPGADDPLGKASQARPGRPAIYVE